MAGIERTAEAVWTGDLPKGKGTMNATSGVLNDTPYTFATRFENAKGTNPEELIAAAHAACYSMAFANTLSKKGHTPERVTTHATCTFVPPKITKMRLVTRGVVPGLDDATFKEIAEEAEKNCPVSNLLRNGLEIELDAALE